MAENKATIPQLVLDLEDQITNVIILADSMANVRNVFSEVAQDAEEKITSKNQMFFLHENHCKIQMIDDLMHRLTKEMAAALEILSENQKLILNKMEFEKERL